jgi:ATP adenylyltransferase
MFDLLDISLRVLEEAMNPDGFNIGMNLGKAAGAGVDDHVHIHVVPRWSGDTNFMAVLGEVRIINEDLGKVWKRLRPLFKKYLEQES